MTDWQTLFDVVLGVCGFALAALCKVMWDTLQQLRRDLQKLADTVQSYDNANHNAYMRRDDFFASLARLESQMMSGFDRIEKRLEGKADK